MPRPRHLLRTLLLAVCLASSPLLAADWSHTFPKDAVASYLETPQKVMVVAAGEGAKEAAGALEAALRDSGRAPLVMNDQALGPVTDLDDQAIVKKAAALPIDRVAVVRVFPGGSGQPANVVVTLYDKTGAVASAFTAREDAPLPAREGAATTVGQGVNSTAAATVSKVVEEAGSSPSSQDDYDKQYLSLEEVNLYNQYGTQIKTVTNLYQGKYKKKIEADELFTLLERPDLATQLQQRKQKKQGLVVGGAIIGGLGVAGMLAGVANSETSSGYFDNEGHYVKPTRDDSFYLGLVGGGATVLVGTLMAVGGSQMNPMPISDSETAQLIDEYNKKLKKKLGLSSANGPRRSGRPGLAVRLIPSFGPGTGGLLLSGRF